MYRKIITAGRRKTVSVIFDDGSKDVLTFGSQVSDSKIDEKLKELNNSSKVVSLDSKKLQDENKQLNEDLKKLQDENKQLGEDLKASQKAANDAKDGVKKLQDENKQLNKDLKASEAEVKKLQKKATGGK